MGNTFGSLFRITTWGESHGPALGVVVDGCPAGIPVSVEDIQTELDRRRPGQSKLVTPRQEPDQVEILSGIFQGKTLGTPVSMMVRNKDAKSSDYDEMRRVYRPSHADYTYDAKYGRRDWRGGGRASARETIGRVAAGALARRLLRERTSIEVLAWVRQVHDLELPAGEQACTREDVEVSPIRCPDPALAERMEQRIQQARADGDSLGGVVECVARGVPPGLGEPVFRKLEADLAAALMSLPAARGFEVGSGFRGVTSTGSAHNDAFYKDESGRIRTRTNHSGGIQGGISNGEDIVLRLAFKPTATIRKEQETVDREGRPVVLAARGRHDPCVLPRAVPIVEAMVLLVLADHWLCQNALLPRP